MNHTHLSAGLNIRRHVQTLSTTNLRALVREHFKQTIMGMESRERRIINAHILSASVASVIVSSQNEIPNKALKMKSAVKNENMQIDNNTPSTTTNPFCTVNSYVIHNNITIPPYNVHFRNDKWLSNFIIRIPCTFMVPAVSAIYTAFIFVSNNTCIFFLFNVTNWLVHNKYTLKLKI